MTGGHPMMTRVTAMGCALTGVVAAFTAKAEPFEATTGALADSGPPVRSRRARQRDRAAFRWRSSTRSTR